MRILAIGDFHGKFPSKLRKLILKENPDLIVSNGDYANADAIRKIVFKYWTTKRWWEVVGLKRARKLEKESFDSGVKILKELNGIGKKVYLIWGNSDFDKEAVSGGSQALVRGNYNNRIRNMKNLVLIDKKKANFGSLGFIGYGGYIDATEFVKHPIDEDREAHSKRVKLYKKSEKRLMKLFLNKKPKNFIFVIHYTPYGIFDKVKYKGSPMYGKHIGWMPYNNAIKKYKPKLVICGHMHEYQGVKRLGKTLIVNPGVAAEGKAAVIDLNEKSGKIGKVRFVD